MRGERVERSNAHLYETGAMRRTHLREHENILKRLIVHEAGLNLGLLLRRVIGIGKPRRLQDRPGLLGLLILWLAGLFGTLPDRFRRPIMPQDGFRRVRWPKASDTADMPENRDCSTGC